MLDWVGKKYFVSNKPMHRAGAQQLAHQLNGRVVTVSNAEEEQFLFENGQGLCYWIEGWRPVGSDLHRGWRDEQNRPLRYHSNWGANEPNNFRGDECCLGSGFKEWNDFPSYWGLHACIEWGEENPATSGDTRSAAVSKGTPKVKPVSPTQVATVPDSSAETPPLKHAGFDLKSGHKAGESCEVTIPYRVRLNLNWCPSGAFKMGSPVGENGHQDDEAQVDVTLTTGFWIGATEITQHQYAAIMRKSPWVERANAESYQAGANYPAICITHAEAEEFCKKLTDWEHSAEMGTSSGKWRFDLPTEAQWEYACRAGTTTAYNFGTNESNLDEHAWYQRSNWHGRTKHAMDVGSKRPNAWGPFDMHGNVFEWCRDAYGATMPGGLDPIGVNSAERIRRVTRGGSWTWDAKSCRSGSRLAVSPTRTSVDIGFRIVAILDDNQRGN
jgi:sulfatase modifying factor 1